MDEPTSSLDVFNEKILLKTLSDEYSDKTIIIVSHRRSTLNGCDRILRGYITLESVFTSPQPTVEAIGEDGLPRFGPDHRTPGELERLAAVQRMALSFAESWFACFGQFGRAPSGALCMELYAAAETELSLGETYNDLIGTAIGEKNGDNDGTNHSHA